MLQKLEEKLKTSQENPGLLALVQAYLSAHEQILKRSDNQTEVEGVQLPPVPIRSGVSRVVR